jgi:hypothetical protein
MLKLLCRQSCRGGLRGRPNALGIAVQAEQSRSTPSRLVRLRTAWARLNLSEDVSTVQPKDAVMPSCRAVYFKELPGVGARIDGSVVIGDLVVEKRKCTYGA